MVYLHILGTGKTSSQKANSKGHLFEKLMRALCDHLKMEVTHINKSENGKEIDIEGTTILGNVKFFAECKAQKDPLDTTDIQKFGFKFLTKHTREGGDIRGFLFTLSPFNSSAQAVWDEDLKSVYEKKVACYFEKEIIELLEAHYGLVTPEIIRRQATEKFVRACGDTQLLCVEDDNKEPILFWAQLLMSSDGSVPNLVAFFSADGKFITEIERINSLLKLKPDLDTPKITCLNLKDSTVAPRMIGDEVSSTRTVVRVRMSSGWFDYRFPAAPQFFVGRNAQRTDLKQFFEEIKNRSTSIRGIVFSGKSGIGKSSLALKVREELRKNNVIFLPIDGRLCDDLSFLFDSVNELLFELRQVSKLKRELNDIRVEGLDSLVETLTRVNTLIAEAGYVAVLFFDQFEKVFEYPEVTKAIRTLFYRVTEKQLSILFGFAWKSDLWSLAEGFPHKERDDIVRESFILKPLTQFGEQETSAILSQLENQWGGKLDTQLHGQLITFSRGLPWLLKKACAHILEQKAKGITESELIETNLKLQDLFEADLAGLDDEELSLLRAIAPLLPATLRRLSESFEISNIDRSLHRFIDKRILVKITEDIGATYANVKYDAYSDIFREFLITGNVPIENAYYFYIYARAALKFLEKIHDYGSLPIEQEIQETGKQMASIYNLSRDLRSLGLVNIRNKVFTVTDRVKELDQDEFLPFLQSQLKQNRLVSLVLSELNEKETLPLSRIADLLRELFPPVKAFMEKTREYYSRTLVSWLHEARLAYYNKKNKSLIRVDNEEVFEAVVERGSFTKGFRFPMCFRNAIIECLKIIYFSGNKATNTQLMQVLAKSQQSIEKVLSDNLNLGFIYLEETHSEQGIYYISPIGLKFIQGSETERREIFAQQCSKIDVYNDFISYINDTKYAGITSKQAAEKLTTNMNLTLADATIEKLGAMLSNWAEYAGTIIRTGRLCHTKEYATQRNLFDIL